jgi:heptosyltransferase III
VGIAPVGTAPRRLVYHAGALGDFITSLPAIAAWRHGEPSVLLGIPAWSVLAVPPFEIVVDARGTACAPLFGDGREPLAFLAGVEEALVFASERSPLPRGLGARGVARILRHDPFPSLAEPIIDYHCAFVGAPAGAVPMVATSAEGRGLGRGDAVIAPGSGSLAKNWPLDGFVEVAAGLEATGHEVTWLVGPAEESHPLPPRARVWRSPPLGALASALARCRLYLGNDSGVTHLAAACGCPTVALFRASDERTWAPRGARVRVILSPPGVPKETGVAAVLAACRDMLAGR